jgi:hypothetical protein
LESLVGWSWDVLSDQWDEGLKNLKEYVRANNNCDVDSKLIFNNFPLGQWISVQRKNYKDTLSPERIEGLESVPGWIWDPLKEQWEKGYKFFLDFVLEKGSCKIHPELTYKNFRLGTWISSQRYAHKKGTLSNDRIKKMESISGWVWNPIDQLWEDGLNIVKDYLKEFGASDISARVVYKDFKLGQWVSSQRKKYRSGKLSPANITTLESLSNWSWTPLEDQWDKAYIELKKYYSAYNTHVIKNLDSSRAFDLKIWATEQRSKYKNNKLSTEKIKKLEALKYWSWDPLDDEWNRKLNYLIAYVKEFKNIKIPYGAKFDGFALGAWVANLRSTYRENLLPENKVRSLESIEGWTWYVNTDLWNDTFASLIEYSKTNSVKSIPIRCVFNNYKLGNWVSTQRSNFKLGKLESNKVKQLESIPGWTWDPLEELWNKGFNLLSRYYEENKNIDISTKFVFIGFNLGQWVGVQRKNYKLKVLDSSRIEKLESIPGWTWDPLQNIWNETFASLIEYSKTNSVKSISRRCVFNNYKLGVWVSSQRENYKLGVLDSSRIEKLESIPGWIWKVQ